MEQPVLSQRSIKSLIGPEGKTARRKRIGDLLSIVRGNRYWKKAFIQDYPAFDSHQGAMLLNVGRQGRTDDPALLDALEIWIPKIIKEQPEWYSKQNHLTSDVQLCQPQ